MKNMILIFFLLPLGVMAQKQHDELLALDTSNYNLDFIYVDSLNSQMMYVYPQKDYGESFVKYVRWDQWTGDLIEVDRSYQKIDEQKKIAMSVDRLDPTGDTAYCLEMYDYQHEYLYSIIVYLENGYLHSNGAPVDLLW